ncbi:hypothetical protein HYX10_05455 [Candidatus Woesearchaeota archaeon]|nr:hypothetical protein [Candidatus Woesearchaeota archaeon]
MTGLHPAGESFLDMSETLERKPFASAGGKLPAFLSMLKNTPRALARGVLDKSADFIRCTPPFPAFTLPIKIRECESREAGHGNGRVSTTFQSPHSNLYKYPQFHGMRSTQVLTVIA